MKRTHELIANDDEDMCAATIKTARAELKRAEHKLQMALEAQQIKAEKNQKKADISDREWDKLYDYMDRYMDYLKAIDTRDTEDTKDSDKQNLLAMNVRVPPNTPDDSRLAYLGLYSATIYCTQTPAARLPPSIVSLLARVGAAIEFTRVVE